MKTREPHSKRDNFQRKSTTSSFPSNRLDIKQATLTIWQVAMFGEITDVKSLLHSYEVSVVHASIVLGRICAGKQFAKFKLFLIKSEFHVRLN